MVQRGGRGVESWPRGVESWLRGSALEKRGGEADLHNGGHLGGAEKDARIWRSPIRLLPVQQMAT
jgi:hypothetical protein